MKKIVYIHPYATPTNMSGLARPHYLAREFMKNGYNVEVWSSSYLHFESKQYKKKELLEDGIHFKFFKTPGYNRFIMRAINMMVFSIKIKFASLKEKNVIYISSMPHFGSAAPLFMRNRKIHSKTIVEVRDLWPDAFFNAGLLKKDSLIARVLVAIERKIYESADALVLLKEGDIKYIEQQGWIPDSIPNEKIIYINNGVDLEEFDRLKKIENSNYSFDKNKLNITYVGSIRPMNNVDMILKTAQLCDDKNIHFHIFGDGNQLEILRNKQNNENIENITFYGRVERSLVPNILSRSDLLLLHYSEKDYDWSRGNSSNKLFEYFASGKPVISTVDFAYNPIKDYGCGKVIPNNEQALKQCIDSYLEVTHEEYERQCNQSRKVSKKYDYSQLAKKYIKIMEELK